jgi:hypothetical protein
MHIPIMALAGVVVFLVGAEFWQSAPTDVYALIGTVLMALGVITYAWLAVEMFHLVSGDD